MSGSDGGERFRRRVVLTSREHASGTDRIAEVVRARGLRADEIIVNLQGDEPLMPPAVLTASRRPFASVRSVDIATVAAPISSLAEFLDPSCVKALCARDGSALYFSRAPVPWPREQVAAGWPTGIRGVVAAHRHLRLPGEEPAELFAAWPPTPLEEAEKLEQLRALEHGMRIHVVTLAEAPPAGVDTPQDLERVRAALRGAMKSSRSSRLVRD